MELLTVFVDNVDNVEKIQKCHYLQPGVVEKARI